MTLAIQIVGYLIGLPLEVLLITALMRGPYRRYPFVFLYVVFIFLSTVTEIPVTLAYHAGRQWGAISAANLYWVGEAVLMPLLFVVTINLVYRATDTLPGRRLVRVAVVGGAILFAGITFLIHYDPHAIIGTWTTPWERELSFAAAIIDLALWAILIGSRERDRLLLMLTGGLGISVTGAAISGSLRTLAQHGHSRGLYLLGASIGVAADMFVYYIWWRAFRQGAWEGNTEVLRGGAEASQLGPLPRSCTIRKGE